ncbi:dTDP-4-dehydrorhamnose 3,5-epimerase [Aggregatimonas sangjinii]|uniref:dTDP-4-dehydrorhamnose 3,5-epimerase n=1 Tax=Aggregatimonas sangjinii TaxID=2583587 RepID=A0A5B7SSV7_9FLAO|nr:dTDP-4-dehydrorhamnose 3,5-epimerase [Aggregatimonas sangjinii]QCX01865.1 dTDP-4-dehydrorhamnose 3,5-epimerase [Aggregatimonas sangjinii]
MKVTETKLAGCYILEPEIFEDERGYLTEVFNARRFKQAIGKDIDFVQDNQSFSQYGVVRALHFQLGDHAQAKLIRVLHGIIWDVAVDLRGDSPTYKQYIGVKLSYENKKQLFIPRGFAHGFVVLSATAEVCYKCDNYYHKEAEGGIAYNDPDFDIDWKLPADSLILSEKDKALPNFDTAKS